ncbi:hypothetical protein FNV43_RR03863 [Rhamnella rubrinervis]|uniref:Protein kinase domain-containing protein n=1 Tax=Rhamnella rubrinervis TaxID=2594499 RepID=A0A8K0HJX9_9ROSA|nr:hypothetical protein FNV43_RR03863 [Rhamnella rubrinervis]
MEWSRGPTIGRGSTATVSLATALPSGELFAVKSIELSSSMFLQREQSFLSKLNCPRIVKFLGSVVSNENDVPTYNLCMEYVPGGTLSDAIQSHGGWLEESMIRSYTHQILLGLEYLHLNGLAHCDIKSQNVLIGEDGAKIADLGCAKLVSASEGSAMLNISGTPVFMAPEAARGEDQGFAADIWALGCTIIEMASGRRPWPETNDPVSALYKIGYSGDVPEFPSWLSDKAKDFLRKCLRRNANERWTAKELLGHPFLKSFGSHSDQVNKEFTMTSPISVLDQETWDSLEVLASPEEPTIEGSFSISPVERIKLLIGASFSSNIPNWISWDENWVTVRCNATEDTQNFTGNNNVISADQSISDLSLSAMDSIIHEEELEEVSMFHEELSSDYSFEIVSTGGTDRVVIPCNSMEFAFVSKSIQFEIDSKNFCFIQSNYYSVKFLSKRGTSNVNRGDFYDTSGGSTAPVSAFPFVSIIWKWTRGPMIGRGSTSTVSIATAIQSGQLFVVKSTELYRSKCLQTEQSFLSKLSCPYLVNYRGFDTTTENNQPTYNLFLEYVPQGTLYDDIRRHGGLLNEPIIRKYTRQILQGLEYLHANGLVHCDIKSQNILMGKENAKIADLGCAKLVERVSSDGDSGKVTFSGTPMYMAPEVVRGEEQGFAADIWALGCTVIEMATGRSPWLDIDNLVSALYRIGFSDDVPEFPGWLSEKANDFLSMCLRRDPKERMTARELLKHPFVEEMVSQSEQVKEFNMSSPNSVLDQSLWNSFEVPNSPQNLNHEGPSPNSPAARMAELIGSTMPSISNEDNWTWDEDWIEVRSNNNEENQKAYDMKNVIFPTNKVTVPHTLLICSSIKEKELGCSVFYEDFLFKCSLKSVRSISTVTCSIKRGFVMAFESMENHIVLGYLNFKAGNKEFSSLQSQGGFFCFILAFEAYNSFIVFILRNNVSILHFSCGINLSSKPR